MKIMVAIVAVMALALNVMAEGQQMGGQTQQQPGQQRQPGQMQQPGQPGQMGQQRPGMQQQAMSPQDQQITQRIHQELRQDDQISGELDKINIHSQQGRVTLSGTVESEELRNQIAERVREVSGVEDVNNMLVVQREGGGAAGGGMRQ